MPSLEELKIEEERKKKETEIVAQQYVVDNFMANNFGSKEYIPSFLVNNDIYETEKPVEEFTSQPEVIDVQPEQVETKDEQPQAETLPEETVEINNYSNARFQEFLQKDIEESNKAIEEIKKQHPNDYDSYVASLRKSKYYQERLKYWQEYYTKKKEEFDELSKNDAQVLDEQAKNDALRQIPEENEEQKLEFPIKKTSKKSVLRGEGDYETSLSMKADPALKDTIEQILLTDLYNSLDKYRSYYKSGKAVPNTNGISNKMKEAMHKINEARTEFAVALFSSYSEVFNTADNKRVKKPFLPTIKAVQKRINSKHDNMTMSDIADVVMDRFYHVEDGKISGIIPELAEKLTVQVQTELVKRGQYHFNLCQDAAEEILKNIANDSNLVSNIVEDNSNSLLYLSEIKSINKLYQKLANGINNGKVETSVEYIEQYSQYLQRMSNENETHQFIFEELSRSVDNLKVLTVNAKELLEGENQNNEQLKNIMTAIEKEKKYLKSMKDVNNMFEDKSMESFEKSNKLPGTQALTDKLTMDAIKLVGSYSSINELNSFQFTSEQCEEETQKLLDYVKTNTNLSVDVNLSMLFNIGTIVSDIREKFKYASENPNKQRYIDKDGNVKEKNVAYGENKADTNRYQAISEKAQHLLDTEINTAMEILSAKENIDNLTKDEQEVINKAFNSFIELSKETRKSERRKEVALEKSL